MPEVLSDKRIGIHPKLKLVYVHLVAVVHEEICLLEELLAEFVVLLLGRQLLEKTIAILTIVIILGRDFGVCKRILGKCISTGPDKTT